MPSEVQTRVLEAVKDAMRAREKQRLGILRLITADFKKVEVDERIELDDTRVLAILDKMLKQRKDSAEQFQAAGRDDLYAQEVFEISVIQEYMPESLGEEEVTAIVEAAVIETGAESMKDMGKLMAVIKPQVQGRADMGMISKLVKAKLT